MRILPFLIFLIITIDSFAQDNDKIAIPVEIQQQIDYRDSINSPLNEIKSCYIFCDNKDSLRMIVSDGYIVKDVDFRNEYKIEINNPLPYKPNNGNKNVLFLHFQPDFNEDMKDCPSSNLVVFLELGDLKKQQAKEISKNIGLALYTGGPFFRFQTKGEVNGGIEIVDIENDIAYIVLSLDFEILDENITGVKIETYIRIVEQFDIE